MTATAPETFIVLSDRWHTLTRFGLRIGSPDVGMSRVELIGDATAWAAARAHVVESRAAAKGSDKTSITAALHRIDAALA